MYWIDIVEISQPIPMEWRMCRFEYNCILTINIFEWSMKLELTLIKSILKLSEHQTSLSLLRFFLFHSIFIEPFFRFMLRLSHFLSGALDFFSLSKRSDELADMSIYLDVWLLVFRTSRTKTKNVSTASMNCFPFICKKYWPHKSCHSISCHNQAHAINSNSNWYACIWLVLPFLLFVLDDCIQQITSYIFYSFV